MARRESPAGLADVAEPDPVEEGVHTGLLVAWPRSEESICGEGQSSQCRQPEHMQDGERVL